MDIKWVEDRPNKTFLPLTHGDIPPITSAMRATAQAVAMAWPAVTPDQTSWMATWGGPERSSRCSTLL